MCNPLHVRRLLKATLLAPFVAAGCLKCEPPLVLDIPSPFHAAQQPLHHTCEPAWVAPQWPLLHDPCLSVLVIENWTAGWVAGFVAPSDGAKSSLDHGSCVLGLTERCLRWRTFLLWSQSRCRCCMILPLLFRTIPGFYIVRTHGAWPSHHCKYPEKRIKDTLFFRGKKYKCFYSYAGMSGRRLVIGNV